MKGLKSAGIDEIFLPGTSTAVHRPVSAGAFRSGGGRFLTSAERTV